MAERSRASATVTVTFDYRRLRYLGSGGFEGAYLTLIDGLVEEAHADLVDFLESLETLESRLSYWMQLDPEWRHCGSSFWKPDNKSC